MKRLTGHASVTAATFGQITIDLKDRKDVYVHSLVWSMNGVIKYVDIAADEGVEVQLSSNSKSAIGPLSSDIFFLEAWGVATAVGNIRVCGQYNPAKPVRIPITDKLYFGFKVGVTGTISVQLLVSESDAI